MESLRGYRFRRLMAEKKRGQKLSQQDSEEISEIVSETEGPSSSSVDTLMSLITDSLRRRLQHVGTVDPWVIERADIYQKAIQSLETLITTNNQLFPNWLQRGAQEELGILAQGLEQLFSGRVSLQPKPISNHSMAFEGYLTQIQGQTRRVTIFQSKETYFSDLQARYVKANCQIYIKDIKGISQKGTAIADRDTEIRCGLRYNRSEEDNYVWTVTLASGCKTSEHQWRVVRPLSQAIHHLKEQGVILGDQEHPYAFHYADLSSILPTPIQTKSRFRYFIGALEKIFQQLPQRQRILVPGGILEAGFSNTGLESPPARIMP